MSKTGGVANLKNIWAHGRHCNRVHLLYRRAVFTNNCTLWHRILSLWKALYVRRNRPAMLRA